MASVSISPKTLRLYSAMLLATGVLYLLRGVAGFVAGNVLSPVWFIVIPFSGLWGPVFLILWRRVRQGTCLCSAAGVLGGLLFNHFSAAVLFLCYSAPLRWTLVLTGWSIILAFPTFLGIRTCVRWRREQQMPHHSRVWRILKWVFLGASAEIAFLVIYAVVLLAIVTAPREPRTEIVSQPVAVEVNYDTLEFSPDGKFVGYLWRDAEYFHPGHFGARPPTMTDALEVRWFPVGQQDQEQRVPLDSIDLRPDGRVYFGLDGLVRFSPDSRHLGAICDRRLVLIAVRTGHARRLEFPDEHLQGFTWTSSDQIVYITDDEVRMTFWRYTITDPQEMRTKVYQETRPRARDALHPPDNPKRLPWHLPRYSWSPDGRSVLFERHPLREKPHTFLDLTSGKVVPLMESMSYNTWNPDGSAVLVCGQEKFDLRGPDQVFLVDAHTGRVTDLTGDFEKAFGKKLYITFVSPLWTPDGKYVILYNTEHLPPASPDGLGRSKDTSYLIQLQPFKIILSNERTIRWSPIPGWVLLQGSNGFEWIDYAGKRKVPLNGWPNNWCWSPDGVHAAEVRGNRVVVFKPTLPTQ